MTKAVTTMEINLNEIKNPHPNLLKVYKDNNAMEMFYVESLRPEYKNEERLFLTSQASGASIKHEITGIYRKQIGSKEYVFFFEHLMTKDFYGNNLDHTRLVGRYELPHIIRPFSLNPASVKSSTIPQDLKPTAGPPEVESVETVHEWEFSQIKPQLERWYKDGLINDNTKLYVWTTNPSIKYSVSKWHDFITLDMDSLILLGRAGNRFQGLLQDQDITPEILSALRAKLKEEVIAEIGRK